LDESRAGFPEEIENGKPVGLLVDEKRERSQEPSWKRRHHRGGQ